MLIVTTIKIDLKQQAYWSFQLVHDKNVMLEVISDTFNPRNKYEPWKQYEMASNRMAKEIMAEGGMKEQFAIHEIIG